MPSFLPVFSGAEGAGDVCSLCHYVHTINHSKTEYMMGQLGRPMNKSRVDNSHHTKSITQGLSLI